MAESVDHVLEEENLKSDCLLLDLEIKLLGHVIDESVSEDNDLENAISAFCNGNYEDCMKTELLAPLWKNVVLSESDSVEEHLCQCVTDFINKKGSRRELAVLLCGASALQLFVRDNWTGPSTSVHNFMSFITEVIGKYNLLPESLADHAVKFLSIDGALYPKVNSPELLWLARVLLCMNLKSIAYCQTFHWWALRCIITHQTMLDEKSPNLNTEAKSCFEKTKLIESVMANDKYRRLQIQFHLECSSMFLCYYDTKKSEEHLQDAKKIAGLDISLTGALGKRTYFQESAKAQLKLNVTSSISEENSDNYSMELPKDIALNDGVRREKISFTNDADSLMNNLTPEEQAIILSLYVQIQITNPIHKLVEEELMAYLNAVFSQPRVWSVQAKALFLRSQLEAKRNKTKERAMMQFQELVGVFSKSQPTLKDRLYLFYSVCLPPVWKLEKKLADLLLNLGAVSSALEIYLRLEIWDKVISCYQLLERKGQAEEIIRQQLEVKETPNLLCTLGDVTDNVEYYEKAWELSNGRSARAQRCMGQYYFAKKEYSQCIPFFKRSLELNHLQLGVSSNLGYAAMQIEDWENAASGYRHCLSLEPDNFQAWNNLANAYLKLNQKPRAWKALQEALRCDFDNWRIWENYMVVSVDCRAFDEGIMAYHRILELKEKHVDLEILTILTNAVIQNLPCNDESSSMRLKPKLLQLFGRLTSQVTNNSHVWDLYANLVSANCENDETNLEKVIQLRQKAQRIASQQNSWEKTKESCEEVVDLSLRLANDHGTYFNLTAKDKNQYFVSVKLMLRGISTKLKQCQGSNLTSDAAPYLLPLIDKVDLVLNSL